MDTELLVGERIDAGEKFIETLASTGFDVTAACWLKTVEEDRWFFYISSNFVDDRGLAAAYREASRISEGDPVAWALMTDVVFVGTNSPITREVLELRGRYPARIPTRARPPMIGNIAVEEIYIYSPLHDEGAGPRQAFRVTYSRQGETNTWRGETKREGRYRRVKAKGAVAYSTARWEGEQPGSEKFATVSVLLEVDPGFDRENLFIHPAVWRVMADQARELADRMFKERHPDAVIEHDSDED